MKHALTILMVVMFWSASVYAIDHSTATLSQGRYAMGATTVDAKAMFAGGHPGVGDVFTNRVDIYDAGTGLPPTDSNAWSTATLSQARQNPAATAVGSIAFFAGGYNLSYHNVVDIYNADANTWSTHTLSCARDAPVATTVANKAIFAGGSDAVSPRDEVDIYDAGTGLPPTDSNAWSTATLSQARWALAATTVGDKAIFAGGGDASNCYDTVDIYDASSDTWTTHTLSQARMGLAATTVGNKAIFAGGHWGSNYYDTVDIYDASMGEPTDPNAWSTANLSQPRYGLAAAGVCDRWAFFAGGVASSGVSNVVDVYADANWTTTTPLDVARGILSGTALDGNAFFAGGEYGLNRSDLVDIYTPEPATLSLLALGGVMLVRRRRFGGAHRRRK